MSDPADPTRLANMTSACLGGCGSTQTTPADDARLAGDGVCHRCTTRLAMLAALASGGLPIDGESAAWRSRTLAARAGVVRAQRIAKVLGG